MSTPSVSLKPGICARTTIPTKVAVAGSKASMSAKLARGSRDIASWSQTYGITDEQTPTPTPARINIGLVSARRASANPTGMMKRKAIAIAAPSRSTPPLAPASETLWPSTM